MTVKRITRLWHLYGTATDTNVHVVAVGPCDWAPSEVPPTELDPFGGEPLPFLASFSCEPTETDHKRALGIEDDELTHHETFTWNDVDA